MNNIDKLMLFVLICALLTIVTAVARVDSLNKIIKSVDVCETYGLSKKTRAFDVKSEIISIQCE